MNIQEKDILHKLSPKRTFIPLLIGLLAAVAIFYWTYEPSQWQYFREASLPALLGAIMVLLIRDGGYTARIRYLSQKELSWQGSLYSILLWEFASAVTPSVVGGTAVAIFILNREGIRFGKALAYVLLTAVLDNAFFILAAPLSIWFSKGEVFVGSFNETMRWTFLLSYALIALYTFFMAFGLLARPRLVKWLLMKATTFRWFKRWRKAAYQTGNDIILASREIKGKPWRYWLQAAGFTLFIWIARYATLNFLMETFIDLSFQDHLLVFGRQVVLWISMLISPTPGSTGTAEYFFTELYSEFLGSFSGTVGILWRLLTYYPYLLIGIFILPMWLRRTQQKLKTHK
ncbi:MAG: hypothetical protein KatS3mg033_0033 [Thermonema sp.]|uniref:lysylphosphatidylglycerol synthase transmembrane domain-containing protein n=1 Tax=Thermonema TaxID=28194 RepID=UPI0005713E01|nr:MULTISPECIES: lysylphosphatidylglycerol synthase transmembrane domain-containing protein [Thermonema]GIV38233.1 MAG: hypothetical protein KatS3mg033_0033 [Thermonema sp.]